MKVFLTSTSLLPSYGGPAYSVARLAHALANEGLEVGVWAADRNRPENTSGLRIWTESLSAALTSFGRPEVIHDNGLWLAHHHELAVAAASRGIARVVSTRGMLEPWAVRHKRLRKAAAWWLYQRRDLQRARMLHATSIEEAANLLRLGLASRICTIPNGIDLPDLQRSRRTPGSGPRTALFLGRIYPVKGLPMLVEAWAKVRPRDWRLRIAGPDEAGHRSELERTIATFGLEASIHFVGSVAGNTKRALFESSEVLVLPSHSESFGVVVAEALAQAVPVLTTDATPWKALEVRGCGWSVPASVDGLIEGLHRVCAQEQATLARMGAAGRRWMEADFGWDRIARRFVTAYREVTA